MVFSNDRDARLGKQRGDDEAVLAIDRRPDECCVHLLARQPRRRVVDIERAQIDAHGRMTVGKYAQDPRCEFVRG